VPCNAGGKNCLASSSIYYDTSSRAAEKSQPEGKGLMAEMRLF